MDFEIPVFLPFEQGNTRVAKFKCCCFVFELATYCPCFEQFVLNSATITLPCSEGKKAGISKSLMSFFNLYPVFQYTLSAAT